MHYNRQKAFDIYCEMFYDKTVERHIIIHIVHYGGNVEL